MMKNDELTSILTSQSPLLPIVRECGCFVHLPLVDERVPIRALIDQSLSSGARYILIQNSDEEFFMLSTISIFKALMAKYKNTLIDIRNDDTYVISDTGSEMSSLSDHSYYNSSVLNDFFEKPCRELYEYRTKSRELSELDTVNDILDCDDYRIYHIHGDNVYYISSLGLYELILKAREFDNIEANKMLSHMNQMKTIDFSSTDEVVTIDEYENYLTTIIRLDKFNFSGLPILCSDDKALLSVITLKDVLFAFVHLDKLHYTIYKLLRENVSKVISLIRQACDLEKARNPRICVLVNSTLPEALSKMHAAHIRRVYIADEETHLVGIFSLPDLSKALKQVFNS